MNECTSCHRNTGSESTWPGGICQECWEAESGSSWWKIVTSLPKMKERPIICIGHEVRAILDGRMTQMRRIVKPQPEDGAEIGFLIPQPNARGSCAHFHHVDERGIHTKELTVHCPYGMPGDRLWVRETWRSFGDSSAIRPAVPHSCQVRYEADGVTEWRSVPEGARGVYCGELKRRSPIHMPRWASRITLGLTGVRIERLNEITESDAQDEGAGILMPQHEYLDGNPDEYRQLFRILWESIHGPGSWEANPFVWVLEFKEVTL